MDRLVQSKYSQVVIVSICYFLSWGYLITFVADALFWDDWVFFEDPKAIENHFNQAGAPWFGYFHTLLGYSPRTYSIITFLSFWVASLSFLGVLRRSPSFLKLSPSGVLLISIFFSSLPLNLARVSGITVVYSLSYALFFLAWYFLVRKKEVGLFTRFIVLFLFLGSFFTNSFLVFFALPFLHRLYIELELGSGSVERKPSLPTVARVTLLASLPFSWWLTKEILGPEPSGLYVGYNEILISLPLIALVVLSLASFIVLAVLANLGEGTFRLGQKHFDLKVFSQFTAGLFMSIVAIFPYVAVGHLPPFTEWRTRDELLLPAGIAFLIFSFITLSQTVLPKVRTSFVPVAASATIFASVAAGVGVVADWEKQVAILDHWSTSQQIRDAEVVLVEDNTSSLNLFNRNYRFYEWAGQARLSIGENSPFAFSFSESEIKSYKSGFFFEYASLGLGSPPVQTKEFTLLQIYSKCESVPELIWVGASSCLYFVESKKTF